MKNFLKLKEKTKKKTKRILINEKSPKLDDKTKKKKPIIYYFIHCFIEDKKPLKSN